MVKNWHFHPIFSHWFQFYYRMAAHNPVFHDDLKTRINLGAAREIRIFLDLKMNQNDFHSNISCFKSVFLHMKNELPPRRCVWTATARHQASYCTNIKGWKKAKSDLLMPRTLANICSVEKVFKKKCNFLPISDHGFHYCPKTVNRGGVFYFSP